MKSYITHAVTVMGSIISDCTTRWPSLCSSFGKDLSYLRRAVEARGLPFLTIVLPSMGKALDRALDDGVLLYDTIPQGYPCIKKRPELFQGLFHQIFDEHNMLRDDACIDSVAFLRQLLYCSKKLEIECDADKTRSSILEFIAIEEHLPPSYPDTWDSDTPIWRARTGHPLWGESPRELPLFHEKGEGQSAISPHYWDSLRLTCRYVISYLGEPDWWTISPQHGPGAVSETKRDFISKYEFPNWSKKLESMFPYDWFGQGSLDPDVIPVMRELPSRLIAVPKDQKGPRLICAEPLSHQWIQQGIWRWLDGRVRATHLGHSITFHSQERSRNRALSSSLDRKLATIDLSSASDRISTRLVEYIFQGSSLLDGFHACRTRMVYQNLLKDRGSHLILRKFSTQGSALTFPIQSIVFLILSTWAVMLSRGQQGELDLIWKTMREVTVFGDDIIVPTQSLQTVKLVLHECGLKVNTTKSFGGLGGFRESCGMDAFRGFDVTPASILHPHDDSPSQMATTVEVANNFFKRGYWHASKAVMDQIPLKELKLLRISGPCDGNFGLYSFCGSDITHLKSVWNRDHQKIESISLAVTSKVTKKRGRGSADLAQYFTERPSPLVKWTAGQSSCTKLRKNLVRV